MINFQILLIILGGLTVVLAAVLFNRLSKVKVWIDARQKENLPFVRMCYLEKGEDGQAAEVHRAGAFGKPAIGIIKVDEKSTLNRGVVEVLMTDINDDAEKPRYRRSGYISFDQDTTMDQFGYIYKQIKGKKEKEIVGYLARPSKPNEPTIYGERSWKTLWLQCVLCAYAGLPATAEGIISEERQASSKSTQPIEHLCINSPKKKDENKESDVLSEEVMPEEIVPEFAEVPILEEPPVKETSVEDQPVTEASVDEMPAEEIPEQEPVDPFAALSEEEKTRLNKVREENQTIIEALLDCMVKVEGGTFTMGADPKPNDTKDVDGKERGMVENNESPKHEVTLSTYFIASVPVTQELWSVVMGSNPSDCKDKTAYPVAPVNWNECQDFVLRLSYIAGVQFALPTEAQWEYAARGGKKSKGYAFAGSNTFSEVGWSDHKHEVGTKKPNELGLYDMSGLVREWCSDYFAHYTEESQTDPLGPQAGAAQIIKSQDGIDLRVVRSPYGNETVTNRKGEVPKLNKEFKSYGLRVVTKDIPERKKQEQAVKPLEKSVPRKPLAICSFWGFHNSKKDTLPAEARAGAYALLQRYAPRQKEAEYASEQPYGWKDTALLSALIYTMLFILLYLVNSGIFQMPLLGKDWQSAAVFVGYYFVLWAIVRFIKIDAIENANSFQPILDLFNKNLGLKWMNVSILILCFIAMIFTLFYYDYDFLPLLIVIAIGVTINMTLPAANRRWKVQASFLEENSDSEDEDVVETEPKNPQGDISRTYEWTLDKTYDAHREVAGTLTLYFKATDIRDIRHLNPFFDQRKDHSDKENILYMFHFLKKYRKTFLARTNYVVYTINKIAEKNSFSPMDKLQFALDFVQEPNITFQENAENKTVNFYDDYIRYPDETLYDKCGDSNSKSLLAAMLFHLMGHNVLYLISRKHQHSAVGVEIRISELENGWYGDALKINDIVIKYEGRNYIFCETTGDNFALGAKASGMSLDEFDEKIYLPLREDDDEIDCEDDTESVVESRIFTWQLDSLLGNQLKGNLPIEMSSDEIEELRSRNPFNNYGQDGNTYAQNVLAIFQYLKNNPARMSGVRQIADYIREKINAAGYPELDILQFALDFVQEPNIKYVVDEKSASIEFAKEYMRFPDEVLFDKEGDCDCKSSLAAALFLSLGYKVIFMISEKLQHAAIGVECKNPAWLTQIRSTNPDDVVRDYNGTLYLYCETTGDGYHIGQIKENESIKDFETILELSI